MAGSETSRGPDQRWAGTDVAAHHSRMGVASMFATSGSHWLDRRRPDGQWSSSGISIAITAALFAAALASMESVTPWTGRAVRESPPVLVTLSPPVARPTPKPRAHAPTRASAPTTPPTEIVAPNSTSPVTPAVTTPVQPMTSIVPVGPPAAGRDSSARGTQRSQPSDPIFRPRDDIPAAATAAPRGAPVAPAGVTSGSRTPISASTRDSLAIVRMMSIAELARLHVPKGQEAADLQRGQQQADQVARRATTAGNSRDVHVMKGDGRDGDGAVGGGGGGLPSIPFPLFSSGPSAATRKRNEAIDADNRLRLGRLEALLAFRRDSVRADSLRRDSLARVRVVP